MYFPCSLILERWLPKYSESLKYLGVLLPSIIFSTKTSLLIDNYYKAYRLEKKLFLINSLSLITVIIFYFISVYIFKNIYLTLVFVDLAMFIRYIFLVFYLRKILETFFIKEYLYELLFLCVFICLSIIPNFFIGFACYAGFIIVYLFIRRQSFITGLRNIRKLI